MNNPNYITAPEAAALLRMSLSRFYLLSEKGKIPTIKTTGKLLFDKNILEQWLNNGMKKTTYKKKYLPIQPKIVIATPEEIYKIIYDVVTEAIKKIQFPVNGKVQKAMVKPTDLEILKAINKKSKRKRLKKNS